MTSESTEDGVEAVKTLFFCGANMIGDSEYNNNRCTIITSIIGVPIGASSDVMLRTPQIAGQDGQGYLHGVLPARWGKFDSLPRTSVRDI